MISAGLPDNEAIRLQAIARYQLDDPGREPGFDHAVQLAANAFDVPISLVSIVGADLQCFKGNVGLDADQTPREVSFCAHAILGNDLFVVEDALADARFADNPLVIGHPSIRFYAGAPLRLKDGLVPGTLCLIDHRPRKLGERDRATLERLARLVVDLIEMRLDSSVLEERHRALDRMKDEFLAATSHELRTPVTSIMGALGLLDRFADDLPENARRLVRIARDNSKRLAGLINDVLDLSRLADGAIALNPVPLDAGLQLHEAMEANSGFAAAHNIGLAGDIPCPAPILLADANRLQQVLSNLVSNAIKFSPPEATVTLSAGIEEDRVILRVSDTGCGIPKEFHSRIFNRFEQARDSDAKVKGGSGLGLAIARELVTLMQGQIGFVSEAGHGTTFWISLPGTNSA
ncbi:MAG: sensor histidine kinase [Novosphingobium sp.]|uniref:sensor histidine kinase n=1 Tax=Novosphingobium sp. TaxID=1874826 RepID=UPI003B99C310